MSDDASGVLSNTREPLRQPQKNSRRCGRPRKNISAEQVEELAAIGCTMAEMCAVLACSERVLQRRFGGVIEKGRLRRNASLRRRQFELAMSGNVGMLIWLGKILLGQTDKPHWAALWTEMYQRESTGLGAEKARSLDEQSLQVSELHHADRNLMRSATEKMFRLLETTAKQDATVGKLPTEKTKSGTSCGT